MGIILSVSILLEQYFITRLLPPLGQLGGLRPMIVFLDIPLPLPNIDWIPVGFLFMFLYGMVISSELNNRGQAPRTLRRKKMAAALTGWWVLLVCILAGGSLFYFVQGFLPRTVRNGIDSFGLRADITLPYPSGELVHLHGSMFLLAFSGLGVRLLLKKTALPPLVVAVAPTRKAAPPGRSRNQAPLAEKKPPAVVPPQVKREPPPPQPATIPPTYRRMPGTVHDQYLIPDPAPDCRLTTPPPVAVILPKPAPRIGSVHPCVVAGVIEPAKT